MMVTSQSRRVTFSNAAKSLLQKARYENPFCAALTLCGESAAFAVVSRAMGIKNKAKSQEFRPFRLLPCSSLHLVVQAELCGNSGSQVFSGIIQKISPNLRKRLGEYVSLPC